MPSLPVAVGGSGCPPGATIVAAARCWYSSGDRSPSVRTCLGCGQGLHLPALSVNAVSAVLPRERLLWGALPLGRPSLVTGFPVVLCVPPPQVWPPGQRRGECGAPTEPADRGGVASGAGGEQTG